MLVKTQEEELPAPVIGFDEEEAISSSVAPPRPLSQPEVLDLIRRASSGNSVVKALAWSQIQTMDAANLMALLAFERKMRKKKRAGIYFVIGFYLCVLPAISFLAKTPLIFIAASGMPAIIIGLVAFSATHRLSVICLSRFERLDSVGELISALQMNAPEVQATVRPALIKILSAMRASDAPLLKVEHRKILRNYLHGALVGIRPQFGAGQFDKELAIAILQALGQIGDASFIEVVTDCTNGLGAGKYPEVAAAAQECLPYLEQRTVALRAGAELVRSSDANHVGGPELLLRPVQASHSEAENELLRLGV